MKDMIYKFFLIFIAALSLSFGTSAQIIDLGSVGGLDTREMPTPEADKDETEIMTEESQKQRKEEQRIRKEILDKEASEFGYKGRDDFIIAPEPKRQKETLSYFAYDYFLDAPSTFASDNVTIPPDYVLGPDDEVILSLFGNTNRVYQETISREGQLFFPEIGPISVAGLNYQELKQTLQDLVSKSLLGTQVSVTLGELKSMNIFVLGEANEPGMYTVSSLSTLTNAILSSGGMKSTGTLRNISVKRDGENIAEFDFYDLLLKGDITKDIRLMAGDVIFIPPVTKRIGISGEVERPGIYELKDHETAADLIKFAGTLKPKANLNYIEKESIDTSGNGYSLSIIDSAQSSFNKVKLNNGDILNIYPVINRMTNAILLSGHTQRPGFYPLKPRMRLRDLVGSQEELLPMTDTSYVLLKRKNKITGQHNFIQADLNKIYMNSSAINSNNVELQEGDEIILFPVFLTTDLVETKLLEYQRDAGSSRQGLVHATKSLEDTKIIRENSVGGLDGAVARENITETQFYEYNVNGYCNLSKEYLEGILQKQRNIELTDSVGVPVSAIKKTELEDIEDIDGLIGASQDLTNLTDLTQYCRRQILDPIIDLIRKEARNDNKALFLTINGNVNFPGIYPFAQDMSLTQAFNASGGTLNTAFIEEVEITSKEAIGKELITATRVVSGVNINAQETIMLQPKDIITIKKLPDQSRTVRIEGEVFFPGYYPLSPGETIQSLVKRAGGHTSKASLKASVFQRESVKKLELKRLKKLQSEATRAILVSQQNQTLGNEESLDLNTLEMILNQQFNEEELIGRVVVDLEGILTGQAEDIILEDGDYLAIPVDQQVVSVFGEVFVPNTHIFQDNLTLQDYIDLSGGITDLADFDKAYIIKADGSIRPHSKQSGFFKSQRRVIEPGDSIVLPIQVDTFSTLKATTEISQIIYQMAIATAAIDRL